jgi:hypothetical protein
MPARGHSLLVRTYLQYGEANGTSKLATYLLTIILTLSKYSTTVRTYLIIRTVST